MYIERPVLWHSKPGLPVLMFGVAAELDHLPPLTISLSSFLSPSFFLSFLSTNIWSWGLNGIVGLYLMDSYGTFQKGVPSWAERLLGRAVAE